jgi:hypothetical protein
MENEFFELKLINETILTRFKLKAQGYTLRIKKNPEEQNYNTFFVDTFTAVIDHVFGANSPDAKVGFEITAQGLDTPVLVLFSTRKQVW